MNASLANAKVALVLFVMEGCPACDDYKPRFARLIESFKSYGHQFVYYDEGVEIMPGQIPVIVLDAASEDESVVNLADQHKIEALPTTLLLTRYGTPAKLEGAIDDSEIHEALATACNANR